MRVCNALSVWAKALKEKASLSSRSVLVLTNNESRRVQDKCVSAVHTAYLGISRKKIESSFYGLKLFLRS